MVTCVADSEEDAPRMPSFSFPLVHLSSSPELNALTDFSLDNRNLSYGWLAGLGGRVGELSYGPGLGGPAVL